MVVSSSDFLGAPNNAFLKGPSSDDEIELYISEVEGDTIDDSVFYITDEEVYDVDDNSYVDDTYDEDDYYFSDADDDDYVNEELEEEVSETDSDDTDQDVVRMATEEGSDKAAITPADTTQPVDVEPNADDTNSNG